jgi:hypothetical protein
MPSRDHAYVDEPAVIDPSQRPARHGPAPARCVGAGNGVAQRIAFFRLAAVFASLALTAAAGPALAGQYLSAGNGGLRSDLLLLIDAGVLDLSAMSWPLPRADLARALDAARLAEDSPFQDVLARLRRAAEVPASGTFGMRFVAGHPGLLRDFETPGREDASATLSAAFGGPRWSTTLVVGGVTDPADRHALRFDGSELTLRAGNWLIGANALDRWWGPGQQGSLILSSNARPIPALVLDRATALEPGWRLFRWIGPWRFTALAGRAEGDRDDFRHPYFMGMRFEMRPTPWIEFAAQRTALFCGDGRRCTANTVWKMLAGQDNRGINTTAEEEPGDGLAGFDLRVKLPGPLPAAFYTQWIGEDVHSYLPVKFLGMFGLEAGDVTATGARWRANLEYADTTCAFNTVMLGGPQTHYDCAYGSTVYNRNGYRYYGRTYGYSTDNDARLWNAGFRYARGGAGEWRAKLVGGTLNRDDTDPTRPNRANTVAPLATHYAAFEGGWCGRFLGGDLGVQAGVQRLRTFGSDARANGYGFVDWQRTLGASP